MTRMAVAGCMALAALGAVAVLDVGSRAAEAASSATVSPFAGTYATWPVVTISDAGRITGSYSSSEYKASISGRVSADGSYSITVHESRHSEHRSPWYQSSYQYAGIMVLDAAGNIVGTYYPSPEFPDGGSFFWLRQQ